MLILCFLRIQMFLFPADPFSRDHARLLCQESSAVHLWL